jgi:uncharacterized membrane protein YbhN (UPF0104 family)
VLWARVGFRDLAETASRLDPGFFLAALALFVPQTLLSGWRWSLLVSARQPMGIGRATALVLAASSMNVVLPSKLGDVAKGAFLRADLPGGDVGSGLALGVFEKVLDTAALAAWMLAACVLSPPTEALGWTIAAAGTAGVLGFVSLLGRGVATRAARLVTTTRGGPARPLVRLAGRVGEAVLDLRARPRRLLAAVAIALVLWGLHFLQFSLVHRAAGGAAPEAALWRAVPMAIFLGLVPVTFAGIGTRDAALVYFLAAPAGEGVALALGAFSTLRYLLPGLAGLPFLAALRRARRE